MFETTRAYVIAFVLYVLCLLPMIRAGLRREWFLHTPHAHPQLINGRRIKVATDAETV
jgi:hypothetical protein